VLVRAPLPPFGRLLFVWFIRNQRAESDVVCRDVVVPLTVKSFDTLFILVQNAGNVVPKSQLLEQVWAGLYVEEGSVTQNICILRRLLAEGGIPNAIETLPKRGYRFIAKVRLENRDAQILIESSLARRRPIRSRSKRRNRKVRWACIPLPNTIHG